MIRFKVQLLQLNKKRRNKHNRNNMLSEQEAQTLACKFAEWVFSHCDLTTSGWRYKYGHAIYDTIEELYDFWYENIKR